MKIFFILIAIISVSLIVYGAVHAQSDVQTTKYRNMVIDLGDGLLLNGENDSLTPVQQAFLLQQRLTEVNHPDHTLITYPNLGHVFHIVET